MANSQSRTQQWWLGAISYFAPAAHADATPFEARQDRFVAGMLLVCIAVLAVLLVVWLATNRGITPAEWVFGLLMVGFVLALFALRQSQADLAERTILALSWPILVWSASQCYGLNDAGLPALVLVVMLAGLLKRRRAVPVLTALNIVTVWALAWATQKGALVPRAPSPIDTARDLTAFMVIGAALVWVYTDNRQTQMDRLRHEWAERRRAEQRNLALIAQLELVNDELERFAYNVSHDLKSPLITIASYLEWLTSDLADGRTDRIARCLERLTRASGHMRALVDDVLALSRQGRVVKEREPVALDEVVQAAGDLLAGRIARSGLHIDVPEPLPVVLGDRQRLVAVFQNLLENAIKYCGDADQPWAVVAQRHAPAASPAADTLGAVLIEVRDNGRGFASDELERSFDLFSQTRRDDQTDGHGIGLALVRRIVNAHGGRVWAESAGPGQGACFVLQLPVPDGLESPVP